MKALGIGMKFWPYLYVITLVVLGLCDAGNSAITSFFPIYGIMGFALSFCYAATATRKRNPVPYLDLADLNRRIKLWNLPCDLLVWGFLLERWIRTAIAAAGGSNCGAGQMYIVILLFGIPYGLTHLFIVSRKSAHFPAFAAHCGYFQRNCGSENAVCRPTSFRKGMKQC